MNTHYPPEALRRFLDGESSAEEGQQLEAHLGICVECQEAYRVCQREQLWLKEAVGMLFPKEFPELEFSELLEKAEAREAQGAAPASAARPQEQRWWRLWFDGLGMWGLSAAAAAAFLVLMMPGDPFPVAPVKPRQSAPTQTKVSPLATRRLQLRPPLLIPKGQIEVKAVFSLKGTRKTSTLRAGQVLHPGDLIQFLYELDGPAYAMVAGINQQGQTFALLHHKNSSMALHRTVGSLPQNQSIQMDAYIGQEVYFVVVSTKPFAWSTLSKAIKGAWKKQGKKLSSLKKIPGPWRSKAFWITKRKAKKRGKE